MKNSVYIIITVVLFIACKKEEIKANPAVNKNAAQDSISFNDFGEHESIHQQEWEEHLQDTLVDTLKTPDNY